MYSWKKLRTTPNSGARNKWVNISYIVSIEDLIKREDFSRFFITDDYKYDYQKDDVIDHYFNPRSFGSLKGKYEFLGVTYKSGLGNAFKVLDKVHNKEILTREIGYENENGVQFGFELKFDLQTTYSVFINLASLSGRQEDYYGYDFNFGDSWNDDNFSVTSSNPYAYPDKGMKNGYLYIKECPGNTAPVLDSYINLSKGKLNGYSDSVTVSWRGAVDTDGNLEGYRLYATKETYYSSGYPELVYTGNSTSYTYRVSGVTDPYDLRFSVEAFDSEGETSDRIQSSTVSVFVPSAPRISGNDSDLGTKNNSFDISYIVEDDDDDDSISVTIKVDDNVVETESAISTGFKKIFTVDTKALSFAKHTVTIIAKDKYGGTDTRTYTFTKSNKAPTISGYDTNLGEKRSAFSVKYTIHDDDNDSVTVVEKLNGSIRRTLSNVQKDVEISLNISESDIKRLTVGDKNTIEIMASDSRGATAFRRYYFTRNNLAPTISGNDKHMGVVKDKFEYVFSISDVEKDKIYYSTYLDNKLLSKQTEAVDGKKYATVIDGMDMIKLEPGKHTFKIVAVDAQGSKSERIITFSRDVQTLIMMLKEPFATDVQSKKVLVAPGWDVAKGAECRVEVCNNGFDTNPTWEDATAMTELNKAYVFQNDRKTATKWGVNIRLMIERKNAKVNSYITGIGGAFE
ncbi:MAG: fibronectin type III domain-containing protein [Finegoldia magna]|nr:fibronectin type III domain-containing protein [Finegoldia magna]